MPVLELIGWIGSALIVISLTQARVLRFRWLNFIGSVVATVYNVWIEVWPFAAMNAVISAINVYWLIRLYREAHDETVFEVVEVEPDDAYLEHVLRVHAADIATFHPDLAAERAARRTGGDGDPARSAFLVVRGDETVGAVALHRVADGVATVDLDWVTPRFRDFAVGEFVYRSSGIFAAKGIERVVWQRPAAASTAYLERVGFVRESDGLWAREVTPAPSR